MKQLVAPFALTTKPLRTTRPAGLEGYYAQPAKELSRLVQGGAVVKLAPGTYMAKPDNIRRDETWFPTNEIAGAAIATAQYGERVPVLMGITAARIHNAVNRGLGTVVVAIPGQRRPATMTNGAVVRYVDRKSGTFASRPEQTALGEVMVTTPEQTLVDLVKRPTLGGVPEEALAAARFLVSRVDIKKALRLADDQGAVAKSRLEHFLEEGR